MGAKKRELIYRALSEYKTIFPCGKNETLDECFTQEGNLLLFWFNTDDDSTHLLADEI